MKKILFTTIVAFLQVTHLFAADTVRVNSAVTYQTIQGWVGAGGENTQFEGTPPYMITQDINESVNGVGFTGLRDDMYQGNYAQSYGQHHTWEWTNDNSSPDTLVESALDSGAIDYYYNNLIVPWKNKVIANGDSFLFYMSPSWYYGGSTGDIPAFLKYSPGEYAEYYISFMNHVKRQFGIVPNYVTMCNEAGNGNAFYESLVATMIKTVMPRIQAAGFPNTWCQYPECVATQTSWQYIDSGLLDPGIWPYIKCLSFHKYGTNDPYRHDIDSLANLRGIISAQTEEAGEGVSELYNDLTLAGVSYWQCYNIGDYCAPTANNLWYTHAAKFWTFRQVMHYVRPGAVRIAAVSNDTPAILSLAFNKGGNITTVILNNNAASITTTVTISGLPAGNYGVSQVLGSGSPYSELGIFTVGVSGNLTVPLANQAIMTIYPHTVNLPPVPVNWAATPNYVELPASSVVLTSSGLDPELSAVSYHWTADSVPAGATVVFSNPNIASPTVTGMTVAGNYVFNIHMSDGTDTTSRLVTVTVFPGNQAPIISAYQSRMPTIVTLPVDTTVIHGFAYDIEADALTYTYSIVSQPAGAAASLRNISVNVVDIYNMTLPGNYVVQLAVSDPSHIAAPATRTITIPVYPVNNTPVISSVSATPPVIAEPVDSTQLSAVTSDPDGDIITHWWTVKSAPTGANPSFSLQGERTTEVNNLTIPGRYVFLLTLIDRTLYTTRLDTVMVNLGSTNLCVGATTSFSDPVTGGIWASSTPAVASVGSATGTISGVSEGTATISYTVSGVTVTGIVTVNSMPVAGTITVTSLIVCPHAVITLTDATTGGVWSSVSTGIATVGSTGIVTGVTVGTSLISYTVTNSCGTAAATATVTVSATPSAGTIAGAVSVCPGSALTLTDATGGGVWSSVSTGIATVGSTGIVTGVTVGTSLISYTVTNSCGTAAAIATVTVSATPSAGAIAGAGSVCPGSALSLTDATGGGVWSSVSTGIATVGSTGIVTGVTVGTSLISYTVTNSCGTAAATATVTVSATPSAGAIAGAGSVCPGSALSLTDATGGGVWSSVSTGIATVGSTGIVTGVTVGTSLISYTVTNSCGTAAATATVTVSATPSAGTITGAGSVCPGSALTLTDVTGGGVWSSVSSGIATVGSTGIVTGVTVGTSLISYTVANSCGTAAATAIVTVSATPSAGTIAGTSSVCLGSALTLTDATGGGVWSSVSTGIATVGSTGIVTGVAVGTSLISYTVTNSCGTAAATATVTVSATPSAGTITGIDSVCEGDSIILANSTTGGTWGSSNAAVAIVSITGRVAGISPGVDTIGYTVTNSCGTAHAFFPVYIHSCAAAVNAVNKMNTTELKVFPNPNNGEFTITLLSDIDERVHIAVTNVLGETLKAFITITNNAAEIKLNAPPGVYSVSATTTHNAYTAKIIVH